MRPFRNALGAASFLVLVASPAFAVDCPTPGPAPAVPDGATANVDQMKAAHEQIQSYANLLQSIQDCYEAKIKMAPKGAKADDLQKLRDAGNAAVDQAKALGDAFSAQVKIFKARAPVK